MAGIFRRQGSGVARALLPAILFVVLASPAALAELYGQPVLIVDPGMDTGPIKDASVDAAGRIAVTGGVDKTLRVWSLTDGKLLQTIRVPAGPENIGNIYAVLCIPMAISSLPASRRLNLSVRSADRQNGRTDSETSRHHSQPRLLAGRPLFGSGAFP
jgi:hypothetical protein